MSTSQVVQSTSPFLDYNELRQRAPYLIPTNGGMAYQYDMQAFNDGAQVPSVSNTSYNSPQPSRVLSDDWQRPYIYVEENDLGVWRKYVGQTGYEEPSFWPHESSDYQQRATSQSQHHYPDPQLHGRSPMMLASDYCNIHQTPRGTPDFDPSPSFSCAAPASKKRAAKKPKDKAQRPKLEKPLSKLTMELTGVPIKDTEAWVNRSFLERQTEKRPDGSIKRPSNSFMLYRSAYTERCRELEKSKNHQDISSIAGESWRHETSTIKSKFKEWAKIERENHRRAFPDYKFQPQTQAAKKRKRKRKSDESSEEASDAEDPSYDNDRAGRSGIRRSPRGRNSRFTYREYSDSPTLTSQDEASTPEPYMLSQNTPYLGNVNLGKPLPQALDRLGQPENGYITSNPHSEYDMYGYLGGGKSTSYYPEDNIAHYGSSSPPIGLPGASHNDLMGELPMDGGHIMLGDTSLVDPELEGHAHGAMMSMESPAIARSVGFRASDYVTDSDGMPYLAQFDREDVL